MTFDASESGRVFDYIFSHLVLSRAAHWQLKQYLEIPLQFWHQAGPLLLLSGLLKAMSMVAGVMRGKTPIVKNGNTPVVPSLGLIRLLKQQKAWV